MFDNSAIQARFEVYLLNRFEKIARAMLLKIQKKILFKPFVYIYIVHYFQN